MSKAKGVAQSVADALRIVILSDLHAHPWSAFANGDGLRNSRLQRSLGVLDASLRYAQEERLPWVFGGDLVHTAGYAFNIVMTGLIDVFRRYPDVEKVAVWGNHDARGVGGLLTLDQTVYPMVQAAVPNLRVLASPEPVDLANGLRISGAGYQPHPRLLVYGLPADIGLYHQTVQGATTATGYGLGEGIDPQALRGGRHRLTIVGHVHHPQQIEAPEGEGILVPGSPEHQNFGDRDEHGWWVATVHRTRPPRSPELVFMPSGSPEFRTVDVPADVGADGHFYRVRSMPVGAVLPANAFAVAPTPTVVEQRDVLQAGAQAEQVLQTWMQVKPPPAEIPAAECLAVGRRLLASADPTRLRNVRLVRLHLQDFCCYQDETLEVEAGTWLVTGRGRDYPSNGCLVGNTLIDAPRDLEKQPYGIPLKDLVGTKPLVYGLKDGEIVVAKAKRVWKTAERVAVWRVRFTPRNSEFGGPSRFNIHDELIGTPDHRVMLVDGTYRPLARLQPGDRLMPLYRRCHDGKYASLCTYDSGWQMEHRIVGAFVKGAPLTTEEEPHHKNKRPLDNNPENVAVLEATAHRALHGRERPPHYTVHPRGMAGKCHTQRSRNCISESLRKGWHARRGFVLPDPESVRMLYWGGGNDTTLEKVAVQLGYSVPTIRRCMELYHISVRPPAHLRRNHKVLSVEFAGYEDVYDIEVPGTNNFVAGGVVVHNSGKTTLVGEALYWVLFGRTTKDLPAEVVIRRGAAECAVTALLVNEEGGELEVCRRRGANGHTLEVVERLAPVAECAVATPVWEAPSVNEMTAKLGRYLGLTPEIFQNLAYFSQEKLVLFSSATDGERKNVLADLMGLRAYQDASSAAHAMLQQAGQVEGRAVAQLEVLEQERARAEGDRAIMQDVATRWEAAHAEAVAGAVAEVRALEQDPRAVETTARAAKLEAKAELLVRQCRERMDAQLETRVGQHQVALGSELQVRLGVLQERVATAEAVAKVALSSLAAAREEVGKLPTARTLAVTLQRDVKLLSTEVEVAAAAWMQARGHHQALAQAIDLADEAYRKADARLSTGVCPTCNQLVDDAHQARCLTPYKVAVEEAVAAAEAARAVRDQAEQQHVALTIKLEALRGKLSDVQQLIQDLQSRQARILAYEQAEEALSAAQQQERQLVHAARERAIQEGVWTAEACRLRQRQRLVRATDFAKRVVHAHAAAYKTARLCLGELEAQGNPHNIAGVDKRLTDLQARIQLANAMQAEQAMASAIADYWRNGFSKQGVQSLLVEEIAVRFNAQRGAIFPLLTQGIYDVQFSTLSRTRAGELRERTEFVVYEHGQPVTYEALSGGQRRRIDIGIMLVLTLAVAEWMGVRGLLGLLILDEVFGFLDASGAEGLVAALGQVSAVIPTIYVITHDTQLEALVPNVIYIEQGADGISSLKGR